MFITYSRKADVFLKSFTKKFSNILPNINYIPRGQTNIRQLFTDAQYLGHSHLLKTTNTKTQTIILQHYIKKDGAFFLYRKYLLEPISTEIKISVLSLKSLKDIKPQNVFSFLHEVENKDSLLELQEKENTISFVYDNQDVGFSFKIIDVIP